MVSASSDLGGLFQQLVKPSLIYLAFNNGLDSFYTFGSLDQENNFTVSYAKRNHLTAFEWLCVTLETMNLFTSH